MKRLSIFAAILILGLVFALAYGNVLAQDSAETTIEAGKKKTEAGPAYIGSKGFGLTVIGESGMKAMDKESSGLADDYVYDMDMGRDGRLIVAHSSKISVFESGGWGEVGRWGTGSPEGVAGDKNGGIWVAHFKGVSHHNGSEWETLGSELFATGASANQLVKGVEIAPGGEIWVATSQSVAVKDGDNWKVFQEGQGFNKKYFINCLCLGRDGNPWVAHGSGVLQYAGGAWKDHAKSGLSTARGMAVDHDGNLWVATNKGLLKYNGQTWTSFDQKGPLSSDDVRAVAVDEKGRVWAGTTYGLNVLESGKWKSYYMHNSDLGSNDVSAIVVVGGGPALPEPKEKSPGSLSGQVKKEDGSALSGQTVEIGVKKFAFSFTGTTPCESHPFSRQTKTDAEGKFKFEDLPPGYYVVVIDTGSGWAQLKGRFNIATKMTPVLPGKSTDLGTLTLKEK